MTKGGKPRCVGRACGPAIKNMYPGAAIRYTEAQCERACEDGSTLCKICKGRENAYAAGTNTKKQFHGLLGGPMTPYSHIVGSEWNLSTRAKNAAAVAKKAATEAKKAIDEEAKASKGAAKLFAEAETEAAKALAAATKERKAAEAAAEKERKATEKAVADAKKAEIAAKRAATATRKAKTAATASKKLSEVVEKKVDPFLERLSGRLGWAQIGHRPYLPSALLPYSSSNGVKGREGRRASSASGRRTSSGTRRNRAASKIAQFYRSTRRRTSSSRRTPPRVNVSITRPSMGVTGGGAGGSNNNWNTLLGNNGDNYGLAL